MQCVCFARYSCFFVDKWHSGLQVHDLAMLVLVGLGLSSCLTSCLLQWACKLPCEPPSCIQQLRLLRGAHIIGGIKSAKDAALIKYFDDNPCCLRPCICPADARLGLEGRPCLAKAFTNCPPITCRRIPWRSRVFRQPDRLCCAGITSIKAQLHRCVAFWQHWVLERQNLEYADSESLSCDWAALSWKPSSKVSTSWRNFLQWNFGCSYRQLWKIWLQRAAKAQDERVWTNKHDMMVLWSDCINCTVS